jgi:hypothetical protein
LSLGCTIKELSEKLDSRELTEWMVYYSMEPWGSQIEGYRDALSCATVANAGLFSSAPKLLKTKPFHPSDFLVKSAANMKQEVWQQQKLTMENNMNQHNTKLEKAAK